MKKLAVVILNFNGVEHLKKHLLQVIENSSPYEVIVADNCSTDKSVDYLQTIEGVKVIQNNENTGFAGGYNDALKQIEGQYDFYFLLNSDVEVSPNYLVPLLKAMDDNNIAACQPKVLSLIKPNSFEHAGACGGYIDKNYYPFCRGRIFDHIEEDVGQYESESYVTWTSGAAMLIRSESLHSAGGFDSSFFAHMEEIDLCIRLGHKGYKFKVIPTSKVFHLGGGTLPYLSAQKVYLNFRNNLFLIIKNHKGWLFPMLFKRMVLDGIAAYKFLFEGKISFFWKVFLAHMALYSNFSGLYKKRKALLKDAEPIVKYRGNILVNYYLEKRKTFSTIDKRKLNS
jgi:hypothetical protein